MRSALHCLPVLTLASLTTAALSQPTLTNLGVLPGASYAYPSAVSADGSVIVGGSGQASFRWTAATGMQMLEAPAGTNLQRASGVSADGLTIAGYTATPTPNSALAVVWRTGAAIQPLGGLPAAQFSVATSVSANGQSFAGYADTAGGETHAVRWTASGIQDLGTLSGGSYALGDNVSADASTVVGGSDDADGNFFAVRWVNGGPAQSLGVLPGTDLSEAYAASVNGAVIVGVAQPFDGSFTRAFRWTAAGGMQDLGLLPNYLSTWATSVSGDGNIVTGYVGDASTGIHACMWTPSSGLLDLNDYLPSLGIDLTGWTLKTALVSADGSTLTGAGLFNGSDRAFVVTGIPAPGASALVVLCGLMSARRRR